VFLHTKPKQTELHFHPIHPRKKNLYLLSHKFYKIIILLILRKEQRERIEEFTSHQKIHNPKRKKNLYLLPHFPSLSLRSCHRTLRLFFYTFEFPSSVVTQELRRKKEKENDTKVFVFLPKKSIKEKESGAAFNTQHYPYKKQFISPYPS
jgi:hypothetical protein